jgi:DNA-binding IclR family transcriptional regulator
VPNAARLLKEFSRTDRELGVSELSRRLGLATSTVHRLLATLAAERLLERAPAGYRLGLALHDPGRQRRAAPGPARGGHAGDGHAAALDRRDGAAGRAGRAGVGLHRPAGEPAHGADLLPGRHRLPATTTSTGKVLLAALPADELELRLARWIPERHTPFSIVEPAVLRKRLGEIAARGWAENLQESRVGVVSVGAPVRGGDGVVIAALSVAAPTDRAAPDALRRIRAAVLEAAAVVSRRLGAAPG